MRMVVLLLAGLLLLPSAGARAEDGAPPVLEVPVGAFVQLDGRIADAEWEGAASIELGSEGARLRLLQRRGTLLLGLGSPAPWPEGASLWLGFRRDDAGDGGLFDDGAVRLDFEPRQHNRPHLLAYRNENGTEVALGPPPVARATADEPRSGLEIAVPLGALGIRADDDPPLRVAVLWMRGPRAGREVWPAGLSLAGPAGRPPIGLSTSEGWGRIGGWKDVGKGGAFPRLEWDAWVAADRELARRGTQAHQVALQIAEDPEYPKEDGKVVAAVRDNLRWIARREPLTPQDVLALAKVLRFLNRTAEALALFDALDSHPGWGHSPTLFYERARALEAADRWGEAAGEWRRLAGLSTGTVKARYESAAARAEANAEAWDAERARRREDAARGDLPLVLLRTTRGDVLIQLFARDVPENARHFLDLVRRREKDAGFFDGTRFHRVIGGYLAQGGDPVSREDCEAAGEGEGPVTVPVETNERHGFWRGAVGLARGMALVNGSQFFVLTTSRPRLGDQDFTCVGQVLAGMDVVDRIERCDTLLEARVLAAPAPPKEEGTDR